MITCDIAFDMLTSNGNYGGEYHLELDMDPDEFEADVVLVRFWETMTKVAAAVGMTVPPDHQRRARIVGVDLGNANSAVCEYNPFA